MRCSFCGWDLTPDGKDKCDKCGKPLQSGTATANTDLHDRPTSRQPVNSQSLLKATMRESSLGKVAQTVSEEKALCPKCGYLLENGECPSCGYNQNAEKPMRPEQIYPQKPIEGSRTIRPVRKTEKEKAFTLTPISETTGEPEDQAIRYTIEEVMLLNRSNTDPKNKTITSGVQASVQCVQGKWSITDQSELQTTFVQASRLIELQRGDLILLGNQLYRFDYE